MYDWDDLKAFLAVARGGSTLAASRELRVNQTTVARRIESLEGALGLKLFERGQSGSRPTEIGRDLLAEAEKVEQAARAFQNRAETHARGLAGTLRVTAIEMMANALLTPAIAEFRRRFPEVKIDLLVTDDLLDIEGGEADIGFRLARAIPSSGLIVRKLLDYPHALYCSRDYAERHGVPAGAHDLSGHELIGGEGDLERLPTLVWMFQQPGAGEPSHRSNSMNNLVHAVRAGLGVAPMACSIGDSYLDLIRCSEPIEGVPFAAWLVMRPELKETPRVRAFVDFIVPYLREDARRREAQNQARRAGAAG